MPDGTVCGCPVNEAGDVRCHRCGEYVNVRCWNCQTPRGEGPCPNPQPVENPVEYVLGEAIDDEEATDG